MTKYRNKNTGVIVAATQWFRNGDHPKDGPDPTKDGWIVKRYSHETIPAHFKCKKCGYQLHQHGYLMNSRYERMVCPGDFIRETKDFFFKMDPKIFIQIYDEVLK